jgi:hypothetical protein
MLLIVATWEVEIGRMMVRGPPGEKVCKTPSEQKKLGIVVHVCHPSYCREHK